MRTDAMQFMPGSGDMKPACKDGIKNSGPDSYTGFAMGDGENCSSKPFKKVLDAVTNGNIDAEKITSATLAQKKVHKEDIENCDADTAVIGITGCRIIDEESVFMLSDQQLQDLGEALLGDLAGNTDGGQQDAGTITVTDEIAHSAEEIVMDALGVISEVLGTTAITDSDSFSLKNVNSGTEAQFAEIVFTLKKLIEGFEFCSGSDLKLEKSNIGIDGSNIDALTDKLRTCTFKIELVCSMLGISESVQTEVARKMDSTAATGILQASNPSSLTMATQHTDRLFGQMFNESQSTATLSSLFNKVKQLLTENNGGKFQAITDTAGAGSKVGSDVQPFDSMVYRALLKIDKADLVGLQNEAAMQGNVNKNLPEAGESLIVMAQNPGDAVSTDNAEELLLSGIKTGSQNVIASEQRIPAALMKMTEESVTKQVTEKLQSVIRSGLSEIRIQLRPESLGDVKMRIRMEGDIVLAKIEVQNMQVKEIMERNLTTLKDALAQHNFTAGSFDIQVASDSGRNSGGSTQNPWLEQEMAHNGKFTNGNKDDGDDKEQAVSDAEEQIGISETGKRYGNNSVEYFA